MKIKLLIVCLLLAAMPIIVKAQYYKEYKAFR